MIDSGILIPSRVSETLQFTVPEIRFWNRHYFFSFGSCRNEFVTSDDLVIDYWILIPNRVLEFFSFWKRVCRFGRSRNRFGDPDSESSFGNSSVAVPEIRYWNRH